MSVFINYIKKIIAIEDKAKEVLARYDNYGISKRRELAVQYCNSMISWGDTTANWEEVIQSISQMSLGGE